MFVDSLKFLLVCLPLSSASGKPTLDNPFQTSFRKLPQTPCVSLFTREGRIGCGTYSRDPMTGTMLLWNTLINSNYYNQFSQSLPKFIAVVDDYEYNSATVEEIIELSDSSLLQGIIVLNHTASSSASMTYQSPAPASPRGEDTPSAELTPDNDYAWNPNGDGLMLKDLYGVPTGYVADQDIGEYIYNVSQEQATELLSDLSSDKSSVFDENARKFPPVMAEFNMYMGPQEMDSKTCLSWVDTDGEWRPKCLPLGGSSVWALAGSPYERGSGDNDNADRRRAEDADGKQPIVMVATNMDATAMFHDKSGGANTAAANILTVLMAAKLLGESVTDEALDKLENKIMFALFQGENYGYIGSRSFLRDVAYPGFQCDNNTVAAIFKNKDAENGKKACLNPLRHELDFMDLGKIQSMIAVDQVGILSNENTFYVQDGNDNSDLSTLMQAMSPDDWTVQSSSAGALPPTPLSSLVKLSEGDVGGIVLTGYDDAFADESFYLSHLDSAEKVTINTEAVAKAATLLARTALAAAYGSNYYNSGVADTIAELSSDDETLTELSKCLLENGNCKYLSNYAKMERVNARDEYGTDLGLGETLGKPPNYYPSVFNSRNGQAFVSIGGLSYGAYTGDKEYGSNSEDKFMIRPSMLATSLLGLLNDFLGRGGSDSNSDSTDFKSCQGTSDCSSITYCPNNGDKAVCTGSKVCVCSRAHYHTVLDEAIIPSPNNGTGIFQVSEDDEGTSPMYTEPYWSNDIGVHVFRASGGAAHWTLGIGVAATVGCIAATILLNRRLKKEKLY